MTTEAKGLDVYRAMCAVKKRLSALGLSKSRTAPAAMGSFAFRGIDDLYNVLCGIEAEENLLVLPSVLAERTEYQTNAKGNVQTHVHVTMGFKFVSAVDGSSDTASAIGEGIDSGDKASGKAQSNAVKQAHLQIYKVPTEGEDIEAYDERVGPTLERQLSASIDWKAWESKQASKLRAANTMGELQETWSEVYESAKNSPNGTAGRLAVVKDECKAALRPSAMVRT